MGKAFKPNALSKQSKIIQQRAGDCVFSEVYLEASSARAALVSLSSI